MKGRHLNFSFDCYRINRVAGTEHSCGSRLVVGLTIDQLRTDYIEAFSALYGERGFKRLWRGRSGFIGMPNMTLLMWISHQL